MAIRSKISLKARQASDGEAHRTSTLIQLPRNRGNIHSTIAESIGKSIVCGEFKPGEVLPNEEKWAKDFGVSRSAVREAIKILMAKNLVVSRPKIGSRVEPKAHWSLLDQDVLSWYSNSPDRAGFLRSLQQFRYIIEPEAAALASVLHTKDQMAEISKACHDMATAPTLSERTQADVRFHMSILKATNNELLVPLGATIASALDNLFVFITRTAPDIHYAQDLHNNIERAIRLRKADAARNAVKKLLANSDAFIKKHSSRR
jgi:DNA-binding FadR family transcriptional regulator